MEQSRHWRMFDNTFPNLTSSFDKTHGIGLGIGDTPTAMETQDKEEASEVEKEAPENDDDIGSNPNAKGIRDTATKMENEDETEKEASVPNDEQKAEAEKKFPEKDEDSGSKPGKTYSEDMSKDGFETDCRLNINPSSNIDLLKRGQSLKDEGKMDIIERDNTSDSELEVRSNPISDDLSKPDIIHSKCKPEVENDTVENEQAFDSEEGLRLNTISNVLSNPVSINSDATIGIKEESHFEDFENKFQDVTKEVEKIQMEMNDLKKEYKGKKKDLKQKFKEKKKEASRIQSEHLKTNREQAYNFGLSQTVLNKCFSSRTTMFIIIMINIVLATFNTVSDISVFSLLYSQGFLGHAWLVLGNKLPRFYKNITNICSGVDYAPGLLTALHHLSNRKEVDTEIVKHITFH